MTRREVLIGVIPLLILTVSFVLVATIMLTNPARRPLDQIKTDLGLLAQKGSKIDQVQEAIKKQFGRAGRVAYADGEQKTKYIKLEYGHYYDIHNGPYATTVNAYWCFDTKDELIEITLDLTLDAP